MELVLLFLPKRELLIVCSKLPKLLVSCVIKDSLCKKMDWSVTKVHSMLTVWSKVSLLLAIVVCVMEDINLIKREFVKLLLEYRVILVDALLVYLVQILKFVTCVDLITIWRLIRVVAWMLIILILVEILEPKVSKSWNRFFTSPYLCSSD